MHLWICLKYVASLNNSEICALKYITCIIEYFWNMCHEENITCIFAYFWNIWNTCHKKITCIFEYFWNMCHQKYNVHLWASLKYGWSIFLQGCAAWIPWENRLWPPPMGNQRLSTKVSTCPRETWTKGFALPWSSLTIQGGSSQRGVGRLLSSFCKIHREPHSQKKPQ